MNGFFDDKMKQEIYDKVAVSYMKKAMYGIWGIVLAAGLLSGCNSDIPDLTEEESALITEYATNLLVKHSELSDRNLLSASELEVGILEEAEEKERQLKADEIAEAYLNKDMEKIEELEGESQDRDSTSSDVSGAIPSQTVSEFFETDGFAIDYSSYEICDSYPENGGEDIFMAMDATAGHKLCVVKFNVQNMTSSDQELDMFSKQGRFTLRTGDGKTIQAQSTMLLDDLSSFRGMVTAGGNQQMVLVFEVAGDTTQMDSMELVMRNDAGENVVTLY